jgi:hypothetical protein
VKWIQLALERKRNRRESTSGFHAVRTSKLDEKILVSQEGLCFMQLGTDLDATEKGGSSYLSNTSVTTYKTTRCQNPEDYNLR